MTFRSLAALTVLTVTAGTALVSIPAAAHATTPTTLNVATPGCSDSPSTRQPGQNYCTVQAAADAAQPGDTVLLGPDVHSESVVLTHSGTPSAPITISGSDAGSRTPYIAGITSPTTKPAITFNGVHDIVLTQLYLRSGGDTVAVNGGSDITITRSNLRTSTGSGLTVSQTTGPVVATSDIVEAGGAHGILATDAPGTEVVGDTLFGTCDDQIELAGASTGSAIENTIVTELSTATPCAASGDGGQISVSAGSVTGTTVDYNIVNPKAPEAPYNWAGTIQASPAALVATAGQGTHDLQADPKLSDYAPQEGSPAIDSANASAPGETAVDYYGHARVTDPLTSPSAVSGPLYDRGAVEAVDPYAFTGVNVDQVTGTFPLTVTATAVVNDQWNDPITSYVWNFGDGSPEVSSNTPTYKHTYTTAAPVGGFTISVTVLSNGAAKTQYLTGIHVNDPGPLVPSLAATPVGDQFSLTVHADSTASTDPLPIVSRTVDFGDHSPVADATANGTVDHTYAAAGFYSILVTETDSAGRTKTASQNLIVGQPPAYWRNDLMARDASGHLWQYQGTGRATAPYAPRTLVGGGWNIYNLLVSPSGHTAAGSGDLFARDASGVLWHYQATNNPTSPYKSRLRVGGGWNAYNMIVGASPLDGGDGNLLARDASGVLWSYQATGNPTSPFKARVRVGGGWNAYNTVTNVGIQSNGAPNAGSDLVARDASGVLWLYQASGNPNSPYEPRVRISGGWNAYTAILGGGRLHGDWNNDLVARDASGVLWLFEGTGNANAPFSAPIRVGGGWNAYNTFA